MKNKEKKFSIKYITVAYSVPLVLQLIFFVYQISNLVISIWNIFATGMMVYLFVYAIRGALKANHKQLDNKGEENKNKKNNTSTTEKYSKKARIVFSLIALVFMCASALFFGIHANKSKGLQIVKAKVVSQEGDTIRDTSVSGDGVSTSESDYIEVKVEYVFDGKVRNAVIEATNTDKIYVDNLKIYVDQKGDFICDYGRIAVWKIEAFIFLGFSIMMLLVAIFSLGIEFVAGSIFMCFGLAVMFFVGAPIFENFVYNDIICFINIFANVGLYMLISGILSLIFGREVVFGGAMFGHVKKEDAYKFEQEVGLLTCKKCGAKVSVYDEICFYCGTKIDKNKKGTYK